MVKDPSDCSRHLGFAPTTRSRPERRRSGKHQKHHQRYEAGGCCEAPRYSWRDNRRTHTTPAVVSAATSIPSAVRPVEIVADNARDTSNRRMTHRGEIIIAISINSTPVMRPKHVTAQNSRIGPRTHPTAETGKK